MTGFSKDIFMSDEEFQLLKGLINKEFGISLKGDKRLTLHTKVSHRLSILGIKSYRDYYDFIISDSSGEELFKLASHITNNETYFFREKSQLDAFSELLKEIKKAKVKKKQNRLRILSLASSSGEEAYTLNILLQESGLFAWNWDVRITGMDIDKNAIIKAREACYSKNSFRAINGNANIIDKYFVIDRDCYTLRNFFTKNVEFIHGNVVDGRSFVDFSDLDFIFCRNVLIYMDDSAIEKIATNLYNCISDYGYLFIGTSESLIQKTDLFVPEFRNGVIVYKKNVKD